MKYSTLVLIHLFLVAMKCRLFMWNVEALPKWRHSCAPKTVFPFEMCVYLPDIAEGSRLQVHCSLTVLLDFVWCFASLCKDFSQFMFFFFPSLFDFQKQR